MPALEERMISINMYNNRQTPETFGQPGPCEPGGSSKTSEHSLEHSKPSESHSNKRKTNWSSHKQKKRQKFVLEAGMKGFLCTCNFQEKHCVRDVYRILNEFSDKAEGEAKTEDLPVDGTGPEKEEEEGNEEISTVLSRELQQLQAKGDSPAKDRKFQVVETSVKNTLFIQSTVPDPLKLAMSIIKDVYRTQKQRSKFVLRLLPIEIVTKANLNDLKSAANTVLEKYFSQEPKTFSIIFNRHSNSNLERNKVIEELGVIIARKNPGNRANLKNPEIAVLVEVIRGFCLLSIAPHYLMYKKYNLLEMCKKPMCPLKQQQKKEKQERKVVEEQKEKELKATAEKICQKFINQKKLLEQEKLIKPRKTDSSPNLYPCKSSNGTSDQSAGRFSRDSPDFLTLHPSPPFPASDVPSRGQDDVPPSGHADVPSRGQDHVPPPGHADVPSRG